MTEKRFKLVNHDEYDYELDYIMDNYKRMHISDVCDLLNIFNEENEQLKQDNIGLIGLLENQSIIIQELHSKILEFGLKEPIALTKEDLKLMDKAISYYTHGGYGE